ncbi:unnamed protein product [Ostreobium quekettii]|uniref:Peptidase S1 domain-containing protein n=1 Tax=Ostreobium quekettii TaxID=121088 RepID=A0A8S1J1V9_9CHLO|nr:unnamed protein product [Ostreobium quekettii]
MPGQTSSRPSKLRQQGRGGGGPMQTRLAVLGLLALVVGTGGLLLYLRLRQQRDAAVAMCYNTENGPEAKSINFKVSTNCERRFGFVVNVMDPLLQTHACTGVLVAPRVVVVPASCIEEKKVEYPPVRLGSNHLNPADVPHENDVRNTCRRITHKDYQKNNPKKGADIALLILESPAVHNAPISGITSLQDCQDPRHSRKGNMTAFGWFSAGMSQTPSFELQAVPNLEWVDKAQCRKALGHGTPSGTVCSKYPNRATIAEWDLGSPILCNDEELVGLASYEQMRVSRDVPYVYTHISEYRHWIESLGEKASVDETNDEARPECKAARDVRKIVLKTADDREL